MMKNYAVAVALFACAIAPTHAQLSFTNASNLLSNTTNSGGCIGVVDINGDGLDDLAKLHLSTDFFVDHQNPDGSFTLVNYGQISGQRQWGMSIGDISNDGHKDLISGGNGDGVHYLRINSVGSSTLVDLENDNMFMQCNNIADIDTDGNNDFFACGDVAAPKIWMNNGSGTLLYDVSMMALATNPSSDGSGNYGSVWTDFDNDGDLDLYIAKCRQGVSNMEDPRRWNRLFVNDGNGNYTDLAADHGIQVKYQSWTADFGDIDNDGDLDLVVTNHDHTIQLFENDGSGNFTEITAGSGLEITGFFLQSKFVDLDNDGYLDLLIAGGIERMFRNNGDRTFSNVPSLFPSGKAMHSFATGDLNNDGFQDVFASYGSSYVDPDMANPDRLWLNNGNSNHWLTVRLQGTESNRDAIGARVTITGPWGTQIREVRAGESYGIVTSFACNFGLGEYTTVPTMTIDWPNGLQEVFTDIEVDQTITVIEGTCISPSAEITFAGGSALCTGGGTITLVANEGFNYTWSTGDTTQQIEVSEPGNYTLIVDDGSSCSGNASVFVPLDPDETPVIDNEAEIVICEGTSVELTANSPYSMTWSNGDIGPLISVSDAGTYTVSIEGACGTFTSAPVEVSTLASPAAPIVDDVTINIGEQATLVATGENIQWYDQPVPASPIATGNEYQTPVLNSTTSYWVTATTEHGGTTYYGGRQNNSTTGAYHNNATYFLLFDAYESFSLVSVKVYANGAGNRSIELIDQGNGATVASGVFNVANGESRVDLNWLVPAAGSYGLRIGSGNPQLWRDAAGSGVDYPYALGKLGAITSSTAGDDLYYFFYDWEVASLSVPCEGPMEEVVVSVGQMSIGTIGGEQFRIWPNPADGSVSIAYDGDERIHSVALIDALGRSVLQRTVVDRSSGTFNLDVSAIAPGNYQLRLELNDRSVMQRLIIH